VELNECLRNLNERVIYFSLSGINRFGDIHLTLADSRVSELGPYWNALRGRMERMGVPEFKFEEDVTKVKIFVGMVPLTRAGKTTWEPKDWTGDNGFHELVDNLTRSNSGLVVVSRPVWVGSLGKFHSRRQSTAGLRLVVELNGWMKGIMAMESPKIVVKGKFRFCRAWEENPVGNSSDICANCLNIGHASVGCGNSVRCKWCLEGHRSEDHVCVRPGCQKRNVDCGHARRWCISCSTDMHYTGDRNCVATRPTSTDPQSLGPASPVVADNTSASGVMDRTVNRARRRGRGVEATLVTEKVAENSVTRGEYVLAEGEKIGDKKKKERHSEVVEKGARVAIYENAGETKKGKSIQITRSTKGKERARSASVPDVGRADEGKVGPERFIL